MFFALCMITFTMMFGSSAMRFGSILVMFGCLIVLVSSHWIPPIDVEVDLGQRDDVSIGSGGTEESGFGYCFLRRAAKFPLFGAILSLIRFGQA
jgi:hypothetical protein